MNQHQQRVTLARAMKAEGMESINYLPLCDDVQCRACKKHQSEKKPEGAKVSQKALRQQLYGV